MKGELARARAVLFSLSLLSCLIAWGGAWLTAISIETDVIVFILAIAGAGGLTWCYTRYRNMLLFQRIVENILSLLIVTMPLVIISYVALRAGFPLTDKYLIALDAKLGFDGAGFIRFVESQPVLASVLLAAYQAIAPQLSLIPVVLLCLHHPLRAYRFISAYIIMVLICCAVAVSFPAEGAYTAYGFSPGDFSNLNPYFAFVYLDQLYKVLHDSSIVFTFRGAIGILTFPSVHAGVAALCIWGIWPIRQLRYWVLGLNLLMMVSTFSHASHYIVDVFAGVALALLSLVILRPLENIFSTCGFRDAKSGTS